MTMLLKTYETQNLLCNVSVNGATTTPDTYAFRGDLVLEEGEIADASGRRLPPTAVVKQAVMLEQQGKLAMMAGALIELAHLPLFLERYRRDLADGAPVIFYVENLGQSLYTELDGMTLQLQAHEEGAVWNTLAEDLRLDKEDFKGQSAEDKVLTVYAALRDYRPKLETLSYEAALGCTVAHRREARGPI
ncbi:hypothetical protein [Stutzerimonas stutzeri]|jgi:hypothetical protein|uniref:hypothetical protein n=1 Tax=Stutzerimonas stutzeri TaxID=316 RepID=UPI000BA96D97|nr:hypothetical protein [Stutzerimonas stutzeri]MDH0427550.1 hypothetical protein [Stutzerimonas stutzeri]GLZ25948.1 hypothetical protein Pstu01_26170 [Stutzerimonas stutzeri]